MLQTNVKKKFKRQEGQCHKNEPEKNVCPGGPGRYRVFPAHLT